MKGFALFLLFTIISLAACSTPRSNSPTVVRSSIPPQVVINSPSSDTQFITGTDVIIQSASTDANGILRVDLLVDGQLVRSDTDSMGRPKQFDIAQTWNATTSGAHNVVVRATNDQGISADASVRVTVIDAPTPTNTVVPTAKPTATSTSIPLNPTVQPAAIPATPKPNPTSPPSANQYTLTVTEAQASTMINSVVAANQPNGVSISDVSLQNGQITANTSVAGPFGINLKGRVVVTVSASSCDVHANVLEATAGPVSLTEDQKTAWNRAIEQIIENQIAQNHSYTCVDSLTIANGTMVIKVH